MNLLRAKSMEKGWGLNLGELARIWKGGCIIRAVFLDRIKQAYQRNPGLANLLVDSDFAREMVQRQGAWRRVVGLAIQKGISVPGMSASLQYFDTNGWLIYKLLPPSLNIFHRREGTLFKKKVWSSILLTFV
ncbi:hypothetical protein ACS0TY_022260 [Phlomoides rotata]